MFNQFTPSEVVAAVGKAAMDAARGTSVNDDFARGQLMSAASTARHLAVELDRFPAELRSFVSRVQELVEVLRAREPQGSPTLPAPLEEPFGFAEVGENVSETLSVLRQRADDESIVVRDAIRSLMHELAEREVTLLAEVIELGRKAIKRAGIEGLTR